MDYFTIKTLKLHEKEICKKRGLRKVTSLVIMKKIYLDTQDPLPHLISGKT